MDISALQRWARAALRNVGERLLSSVGAQVRGRISLAQENARTLRENVKVRREESFRLRQEWKEMRRERRNERKAGRWTHRAQPVGL